MDLQICRHTLYHWLIIQTHWESGEIVATWLILFRLLWAWKRGGCKEPHCLNQTDRHDRSCHKTNASLGRFFSGIFERGRKGCRPMRKPSKRPNVSYQSFTYHRRKKAESKTFSMHLVIAWQTLIHRPVWQALVDWTFCTFCYNRRSAWKAQKRHVCETNGR